MYTRYFEKKVPPDLLLRVRQVGVIYSTSQIGTCLFTVQGQGWMYVDKVIQNRPVGMRGAPAALFRDLSSSSTKLPASRKVVTLLAIPSSQPP